MCTSSHSSATEEQQLMLSKANEFTLYSEIFIAKKCSFAVGTQKRLLQHLRLGAVRETLIKLTDLQRFLLAAAMTRLSSFCRLLCQSLLCLNIERVVLMDPSEDPGDILRANRSREKTFVFDMVFDHRATQEEVYVSTTKSLIEGVISGYNATVFSYGPTGVGKTYTMLGTDCELGIYIHTLDDLFKALEATSEIDYRVPMSYLEIYNEVICDLLNPSSGFLDLEDPRGSIHIAGIMEVSTTNAQEIMQLLMKGSQRTQEPTAADTASSRSQAVLQVTVTQESRRQAMGEEVWVGKLFMADLAGSERAAQIWNQGKRMNEGAHINCSLLALGNCINALSEKGGSWAQFVNFDSKLAHLLKDSLGGNSRTAMIAHISPASTSFEEFRILMYAYRAKNIKKQMKCNLQNVSHHIDQYTCTIAELCRETEHLKERVNQEKEKSAVSTDLGHLQASSSTFKCVKSHKRALNKSFDIKWWHLLWEAQTLTER
ncbi:LOW QUALITY PROTEIN: kinesin-like protein KIF19 [Podargus strigoides]